MNTPDRRSLPPLQLEDHIALLQALVVIAWIAAAGTILTEIWVRQSPLEWPQLGGFALMYRSLTIEFLLTVSMLTVLLLRRDWYERVPRESAGRVRWLLIAVVLWLGLHLGFAFYLTGSLRGPVVPLVPLLVLAALLALPDLAGWLTCLYIVVVPALAIGLERTDMIQSPGPLTEAFIYAGPEATPLGAATLTFAFFSAIVLARVLRLRSSGPGRSIGTAAVDPVTGLFQREFLAQRLEHELARERRYGGNSTLLLIGLDGLDDGAGDFRASGDRLERMAQHLLRGVRLYSDTPTRYGLTTLAVLLPTATHEGVHSVVQRIVDAVQANEPGMQLRFGAALVTDPGRARADETMATAERALRDARPGAAAVVQEAHAG